ncbi:class I SAM-dependent methyltransferase [Saccharospirillum impatiens]|uniref:class I SAM-dependent methyltransferase n=1 Tax=Saccharospirillum impatiens TaxID=169438 RepID=UPI0004047701|nr:class I SAM-dependent methyltransferase [Saccharospirillum impatiens]
MSYYDDSKSVDEYIEMCQGYDGSNIYEMVKNHLDNGQSVLELGSGPGFDIPFLANHFHVTGSDLSEEFLRRCRKNHPDIEFLQLDAKDVNVTSKYDCIYSNKVLHHLTVDELSQSLDAQANALTQNGIIAHSFWIGEDSQEMSGLLFTFYRERHLLEIISKRFTVLSTLSYKEFEQSDSLFVIAEIKEKEYQA